jgi:hypothetical protein
MWSVFSITGSAAPLDAFAVQKVVGRESRFVSPNEEANWVTGALSFTSSESD